jgi:uncharacterized RDD family membrane protein YckC
LTESSPTNPDGSRPFSSGRASDDNKTPITVYDPTYFSPESTQTQGDSSTGSSDALTELPDESNLRPATPQERFAAFFVDSAIFFLLTLVWKLLLGKMHGASSGLLLGSTLAVLYLLYYLLTETFFAASPGKMLAGLQLRRTAGGRPSFLEVLIRNLSRIIDVPFFFVTAAGLMEATDKSQRLGDLLAGTTVMHEVLFEARRLPPETTALAGATRRALGWILDLATVIPFLYGLLLIAPVGHPWIFAALIYASLPLTILWLALSETFFQTTFGKAVFGMKVAQEDGRPAPFATILLRNAFKPLDANPLGYLCAFLSSRKQRPGDVAAGTLVFRDRRGMRGWFAVPFMIGLAFVLGKFGLQNPDSFLRKNVALPFGAYSVDPVPTAVRRLKFLKLGILIEDLDLGLNDQEPNAGRIFAPGQAVYLLFRLSGYSVQMDKAWIQADLKVQDANKAVVLDKDSVINSSLNVGQRKSARLISRFSLSTDMPPGLYTVTLTIRDMFAGKAVEETKTFTIR